MNELLAVLPAESLEFTFTVVVPTGKVEPEAGLATAATVPLILSDAEQVKLTVAPEEDVASTVILEGTVITGGTRST